MQDWTRRKCQANGNDTPHRKSQYLDMWLLDANSVTTCSDICNVIFSSFSYLQRVKVNFTILVNGEHKILWNRNTKIKDYSKRWLNIFSFNIKKRKKEMKFDTQAKTNIFEIIKEVIQRQILNKTQRLSKPSHIWDEVLYNE